MGLTKKQLKAIAKFWKRGWFFSWDLHSIFASTKAKDNCIRTLLACKIIKEDNFRFCIDRKVFLDYQKEQENESLEEY